MLLFSVDLEEDLSGGVAALEVRVREGGAPTVRLPSALREGIAEQNDRAAAIGEPHRASEDGRGRKATEANPLGAFLRQQLLPESHPVK